jgi:hypothetical protein
MLLTCLISSLTVSLACGSSKRDAELVGDVDLIPWELTLDKLNALLRRLGDVLSSDSADELIVVWGGVELLC